MELLLADVAGVRTGVYFVIGNALVVDDLVVYVTKMAAHLADVSHRQTTVAAF